MPRCIVVPGFLSCELWLDAQYTQKIWVDYGAIFYGNIGTLRLAADGIAPGRPGGTQLYVGDFLRDYWARPLSQLKDQLKPHGYRITGYIFDWRLHLAGNAVGLANLIRSQATPADPCSIVAHSMGGVLARLAWAELAASLQTNLVRRLITLGSPHQGSYAPVAVASEQYEALDQLVSLTNSGARLGSLPNPFPGAALTSRRELSDLALTWPGMYALMPLLQSADSAADPDREYLYFAANWPTACKISQLHLDYARNVIGPALRSPTTLPPSWVLTTVSGYGVNTPNKLLFKSRLGAPAAMANTDLGDGVVTQASAEIADAQVFRMQARHSDMPIVLAASGELADMVLAVRSPPAPTPAVIVSEEPLSPQLAGPPVPTVLVGTPAAVGCPGGMCRC